VSHPTAKKWLNQLDKQQKTTRPRRTWLMAAGLFSVLLITVTGLLFYRSLSEPESAALPTRAVMQPLASLTPLPIGTATSTPTLTATVTHTPSASATITSTPRPSATPLPSITASPQPSTTPTNTPAPTRRPATATESSALQVISVTALPTVPPGNEEHVQHAFRLVFGMRQIRDLTVTADRVQLGFVLDMTSRQTALDDINRKLVSVTCNLRREGFVTHRHEFTAYARQDTYNGTDYRTAARVVLLPETVTSLDCRQQQRIRLEQIAFEYTVTF
jgi:hypothetical protein